MMADPAADAYNYCTVYNTRHALSLRMMHILNYEKGHWNSADE